MASQMTRNRRSRGRRKKYDNAVPGSGQRGQRRPLEQRWHTHLGAFRTRKEALRNNLLPDEQPVLKRL